MYEELIKALRCGSSSMANDAHDCNNCKYASKEEVKKDFPMPPDYTDEDGKEYWIA